MDWYALTPELSVILPHCPEPTQVVHLRRATAQFCQDSRIWTRPFELYVLAGLSFYELSPPEQASIIALDWLSLNGERLNGRNSPQMSDRPDEAPQGRPTSYYRYPGAELVLDPVPDRRYTLQGAMSLQPVRTATEIPDWLGDDWGDAIIALAAAHLASLPGKDWTDAGVAQTQMMLYQQGVRQAIQRKKANDQPATRVVRYGGL